jgi:hypothetical protein
MKDWYPVSTGMMSRWRQCSDRPLRLTFASVEAGDSDVSETLVKIVLSSAHHMSLGFES